MLTFPYLLHEVKLYGVENIISQLYRKKMETLPMAHHGPSVSGRIV